MRLDKYLSDMQVGSRKDVKSYIKKRLVTVNGETEKDPGSNISPGDIICVNNQTIPYLEHEYILLNKPAGVISATTDPHHKTVIDLLGSSHRRDLFPVGRLDIDTVGLLLITDDGDLSHRLLSPKHHVDKTYYAKIDGIVTDADAAAFANGLPVDDAFTALPADLHILSVNEADGVSEVELTIREGKFHQVKRMFEATGSRVTYLKRIRMGTLTLDPSLPEGSWRYLTDEELFTLTSPSHG